MKNKHDIDAVDWDVIESDNDYIHSHKSCEEQYNID